jgi:hypothetical protein
LETVFKTPPDNAMGSKTTSIGMRLEVNDQAKRENAINHPPVIIKTFS